MRRVYALAHRGFKNGLSDADQAWNATTNFYASMWNYIVVSEVVDEANA